MLPGPSWKGMFILRTAAWSFGPSPEWGSEPYYLTLTQKEKYKCDIDCISYLRPKQLLVCNYKPSPVKCNADIAKNTCLMFMLMVTGFCLFLKKKIKGHFTFLFSRCCYPNKYYKYVFVHINALANMNYEKSNIFSVLLLIFVISCLTNF